MIFSTKPTKSQTVAGVCYLLFQQFALPLLLSLLPISLSTGKLNFVYFFINFVAVTLIFGSFLIRSVRDALRLPGATVWYSLLGYLGNEALSSIVVVLIAVLCPRFVNINDVSVLNALKQDFLPMAVGTVVLAPVAEETLFRGMMFRGLYEKSPLAAYAVSMAAFAAVHVVGYIGQLEPLMLLLSFIQYLPAGYVLCFAYRYSGSIVSPILIHMAVNAVAVFSAR